MSLLRTDTFVPLMPAATPVQQAAHPGAPAAASPNRPFKALEPLGANPSPAPAPQKRCEPSVSVQRAGDRVTSIRVQCSCGEVIDLACVYPEPDPARPQQASA